MADLWSEVFNNFTIIFWILILIMMGVAVWYAYRRNTSIKELLEKQAMKRGGTVSGRLSLLTLSFVYNDKKILVSTFPGSKYQSAYTRTETILNYAKDVKIEISGESFFSEIGKKLGKQDVIIGSDRFDEAFMIRSTDEMFVIHLLTLSIQDKMLDLRNDNVRVEFDSNKLLVEVLKQYRTELQYDQLIELTSSFLDQLKELS